LDIDIVLARAEDNSGDGGNTGVAAALRERSMIVVGHHGIAWIEAVGRGLQPAVPGFSFFKRVV
jgi:hypothetical protein